ncbi:MAG: SDR family NAD(P)-dependent oxidoreductase [Gammaproteobacteria bacterium]
MKKTALITGASRGIGQAIAINLASAGYNLALVARNEEQLRAVQQQCQESGTQENINVEIFPFDLSHVEKIPALVTAIHDKLNHLNVLINNAGTAKIGTIDESDMAAWDHVMNINLRAAVALTKLTLPIIEKNKSGAVINIASIAAKMTMAGGTSYNATKFGLLGFSGALFEDIREKNIKVCAICPGYVSTDLVRKQRHVDFSKMIQPQDIAEIVNFAIHSPSTACPTEIIVRPQRSPYL